MNLENNYQNWDGMSTSGMETPCMNTTFNSPMNGGIMMPIYECPEEKVCHRYMCYEIPHIKPCNTRIINHHVYKHTYTPCYTSCEENVVENIYDRKCC